MSIDWDTLNCKTNGFRALHAAKDRDARVDDVVFSGLRVKLSEIIGGFPSDGGNSVTIYADTLVVDSASFNACGAVVMARRIDLSAVKGDAISIGTPKRGKSAVAEFLVKESVGGQLRLTSGAQDGSLPFSVPVGDTPLQAVYYKVNEDGTSTHEVRKETGDLQDLIGRPWALNCLKASFTAGCRLMTSQDAADREVAGSMLSWVVACVGTLGRDGATIPGDYAELYRQTASLLVTMNVTPGAFYVPVLSSEVYKDQAEMILKALERYEENSKALEVRSGIQEAVARVSDTLQGVAEDEAAPLKAQLVNIKENLANLSASIQSLRLQFDIQQIDAETHLEVMKNKIAQQRIRQFVDGFFKAVMGVVKVYKAMCGKDMAPGDALTALADAGESAKEAYEAASAALPDKRLLEEAKKLMSLQEQLMTAFVAGKALWAQADSDQTVADLPQSLASVSIDPSLAWDNYIVRAENELAKLTGELGSGAAQEEAGQYLVSLKILARYGKAIDVKLAAYTSQLALGTMVKAQIRAAESARARWKDLESRAKSDEEKLAALKGTIQSRMDAIKRSIFAAWTYYKNAYFYLYFQEPPMAMDFDMETAQLREVFASASAGVARLLGDVPESQQVRLPNDNAEITFQFKILRKGEAGETGTETALLTPAEGGGRAALTWSIPVGSGQLQGVLPDDGNVAIWIKDARFFVEGVKPN